MQLTTCILTLLFLLSVRGAQVAKARVRFAQSSYTVMEARMICMDVINDAPLPTRFTVDFTFSGVLLGLDNVANTRSGIIFFNAMATNSVACISKRMVDDTPCEPDIRGTITLSNNSAVTITNPSTATVVVKDDDAISATFGQSLYMISEGDAAKSVYPFVNTSFSASAQVRTIHGNNYERDHLKRSLYMDPVLNSPPQHLPLSGIIVDDDIALEDAEYLVLELTVNAQEQCVLQLSPFNTTTIIVSDDDDVDIKITRSTGRTREGEDYRLCVSTSKMIARDLRLNMKITTGTADLVDIGQTSNMFAIVLRAYDYDMMECKDIPIVQDNIVEPDEEFTVQIASTQSVPASVQNHLHINNQPSVITIQDTSTCIEHTVGTVADMLYVVGDRTLCFTCQSCQSSEISWKVTSFEGNVWTGLTGGRLHSSHNLTDQGVVYENGTLLITNSSTLFSKRSPASITFTQMDAANLSKLYRIILGDTAAVISLNITKEANTSYKIVCKFRGNPQPVVQWLIGNTPVVTEDRIETVAKEDHFISTLTLKDMKTTQYACRISNPFGEDFSEGFIFLAATTHHSSFKCLIASYFICIFSLLTVFVL